MHPREFIKTNIESMLKKNGYEDGEVIEGVKAALLHFDRTAMFPKGKVFDECFKVSMVEAKRFKKLSTKKPKK